MFVLRALFLLMLTCALVAPAQAASDASTYRVPTSDPNTDQVCFYLPGSATPVCDRQVNKALGAVTALPSSLPPGPFIVPPGADPMGVTDSLAAVQSYITAHAGQRIGLMGTYALSGTLTIPPYTQVFCQGPKLGGFKRLPSATTTTVKPLIGLAAGAGHGIESCEIDLNSPASGNWWAGIQPLGAISFAAIRNNQIDGSTYTGIDFTSSNYAWAHSTVTIEGNAVNNAGWRGISVENTKSLVEKSNRVTSTGESAIWVEGVYGFLLSENYVTKAAPPSVFFTGPGSLAGSEGGFMIGLAPNIGAGRVVSNHLVDSRNANEDGIGLGENGTTSTTSLTVPSSFPAPLTFTLATARTYHVGDPVTVISQATPFATQLQGTVTAYAGTALTVSVTSAIGTGAHADWSINTEPGTVVVHDNLVELAGLFGIDAASNFDVQSNRIVRPAVRGLDLELDYGGIIRNVTMRGNTVVDVGAAASPNNYGLFVGGGPLFLAYSDITVQSNSFVDDRSPVQTYSHVGLYTTNSQFQHVSLGPNNTGGSTNPTPSITGTGSGGGILGIPIPYTPTVTYQGGTPTGSAVTYATATLDDVGMDIRLQIYTGSALNGATGVQITLPHSLSLPCSLPAYDLKTSAGGAFGGFSGNGYIAGTMNGLAADRYIAISGRCQ